MSIEEFKNKLRDDFGVTLEIEEISSEESPKCLLYFSETHTNTIRRNIQYYTFNDMAITASLTAKSNKVIPPYIDNPNIYEVSNHPYTIQIQALLPVVYFFVQRVLQ